MSRAPAQEKEEYIRRFIQVCGTSSPKEISELLEISYTAALNYLQGRLPDARILLTIADKTPYSIHWLLTGRGEKFAEETLRGDLELLLDNLTELAEPALLSELGRFLHSYNLKKRHTPTDSPKTVILTSDKIRKEKVAEGEPADQPLNPS